MFEKQDVILSLNYDLMAIHNRRLMANISTTEEDKQRFWDGYVTALQIRDGKVEILNAFGYRPVYSVEQRKYVDIVPLER